MGCVHTHQGILAIEGWGNASCIQSLVEKNGEYNKKTKKIGWVINQKLTLRPKHDKFECDGL